MIGDEQIKQELEAAGVEFQYFTHARFNKQMCTTEGSVSFDLIANGVRALIALAQEVKPLVFNREHGCLWCKTSIGEYSIHPYAPDNGYVVELDESQEDDDVYETEGKAIEAANIDFRKRVLSCLVNGGGK